MVGMVIEMSVYVFKRNKKTGHKTLMKTVDSEDEAREICKSCNNTSYTEFYEFTSDVEYVKN